MATALMPDPPPGFELDEEIPPPPDGFELDGVEPQTFEPPPNNETPPIDFSRLTQITPRLPGAINDPGDNTDLMRGLLANPMETVKSIPGAALQIAAAPGKLAYSAAADLISKAAGQPEYGGNLRALMGPPGQLPAERFIADVANTPGVPKDLAIQANIAKALPELASMMAVNPAGLAGRLAALGFSADMIHSAGPLFEEFASEYYKPEGIRDAGKIAELGAGIIQTFTFAPLAGAHGTKGVSDLGRNVALTQGDVLRIGAREMDAAVNNPPPGEIPFSINPQRQLGIRVPEGEMSQPGIPELADAALRERQQMIVPPTAEGAALAELRRAVNPPQVEPVTINTTERPGGGEARFGKTSYQREAEAPTVESVQNQPKVEVPAPAEKAAVVEPPKPAESKPLSDVPTADELLNGTPNEVVDWKRRVKYGPANSMAIAEKLTPDDIAKLTTERDNVRSKSGELISEMDKDGYDGKKMAEAMNFSLKGQTLNEIIQDFEATKPLDKTLSGEAGLGMDPLEQKAIEFSNDPKNLQKRLRWHLEFQNIADRSKWKLDAANKRMISPDGTRAVEWITRKDPNAPISYENQQTNEGSARIVPIEKSTPQGGQGVKLAAEMINAAKESAAQMRGRISNVKYGDAAKNEITFDFDGKPHTAVLKGRNSDLILGSSKEADSAVALRALLDGDSKPKPLNPGGEKAAGVEKLKGEAAAKAPDLISRLEALKYKQGEAGLFSVTPEAVLRVGKAAWNTALDIAIQGIKAGKEIRLAIEDAMSHIRKNAAGKFDEAAVRSHLESILQNEAKPTASTPATAPTPTTPKPKAQISLDDIYKIFEPAPKQGIGLKQRAVNIIEGVRTGFSSKFRPINKLAEDIAKAYGRTSSKDIAGIMEQLKGSQGKGEAEIYRFDRDVSSLVKGSEKDFNAYMFLRRAIDRLNQDAADIAAAQAGGNVKALNRRAVSDYTLNELNPKLAELEAKLGPEKLQQFKDAAEGYQQYMDKALRLQVESGRMSPEVYQAIKDGNQFYAPFKVMKYLEDSSQPSGSGKRIDTMADFTKAMTGIEDKGFKLGDMLGAARQSILMSRILADKNTAMRNVAELSAFDTNGQFIKKLAAGAEAPKGWEAVNVLEGGKQNSYAVRPEVAEAIQLYGGVGGGIVSRALAASSIPFRAGATALNLPFQISNLLADVPRQALVSKYGVRGVTDLVRYPLDFVQSLYSSLAGDLFGRDNKLFLDFLDSGVAGTTVQEFLTPEALKFKEPTSVSKSRKLASTVLNIIPEFAKAIEQTSKVLGVKRAMRFEGVSSGAELAKQVPEAITELRRFSGSPDFGRQGKVVEQARLNLLYMFLNARIQGSVADIGRLAGRDGAGRSAATWLKVGSAVAIPTAYLYYLNNKPEYKEDYDKRPAQEKQNYWMIPKDSYITTEDGEKIRDYWRIPKREIAKWFANLTESALNFADKKDPQAAADFGKMMVQEIAPVNISGDTAQERMESVASSLNPLLKAPLEIATGRDLYRHRDLVPDQMKKASPENQYTDRTAEAFKKLAVAMPDVAPEILRSPIILENLTRNLTAGLITQFLPRKPVAGRSDFENTPLLQRFQAIPLTDQQQFKDEMAQLERGAANEQLERHREATKYLEDNKGKELGSIIENMPKDNRDDVKLIKHMVDLWVAKENGATYQDRQLLALPAKQRAAYVANQISGLTPEKKQEAILNFARKRILTEAVAQELPAAIINP